MTRKTKPTRTQKEFKEHLSGNFGLLLIFIFIISVVVSFAIGYSIGYGKALTLAFEQAQKYLDIKLKPWVLTEISNRLGGVNVVETNIS